MNIMIWGKVEMKRYDSIDESREDGKQEQEAMKGWLENGQVTTPSGLHEHQ